MHEASIRLISFLILLGTLGLLECYFPYRPRRLLRLKRWPHNIGLLVTGTLLVKLLLPFGLVYVASLAQDNHFGVLNWLLLPASLNFLVALLLLDLLIYGQHYYSHKAGWLWRLHQVHHTDEALDITSALRFHPLEILLSTGLKVCAISILGVSPAAVLVFEILLNGMAMFNHANLQLPKHLEPRIRWLLVTPQMHIIHHSVEKSESDKNFGFNLSIWDRLFNTYQSDFQSDGVIGQKTKPAAQHSLYRLLKMPFE